MLYWIKCEGREMVLVELQQRKIRQERIGIHAQTSTSKKRPGGGCVSPQY